MEKLFIKKNRSKRISFIEVLIDYKNNVHYILQEKQKIDIYRNEL